MNKLYKYIFLIFALFSLMACSRIQTGEVGLRQTASKQIELAELQPGSWNQTLIGSVLTFPVRDLTVNLEDKTPMTADDSALEEFDVTVVYSINPSSVAELYSTKSKSFHAYIGGDVFLMYSYMSTLVNNASYKAVRGYKALETPDNRANIEQKILNMVNEQLKAEKLDTALTLTVVQVRSIKPNKQILASATEYVRAQNELRIKETEVQIARKESERMAALAANSGQSIAYMNAQATLNISQAVLNGKVQTIIVPSNMTSLMINR